MTVINESDNYDRHYLDKLQRNDNRERNKMESQKKKIKKKWKHTEEKDIHTIGIILVIIIIINNFKTTQNKVNKRDF